MLLVVTIKSKNPSLWIIRAVFNNTISFISTQVLSFDSIIIQCAAYIEINHNFDDTDNAEKIMKIHRTLE